jgi:ABC-type sugar transport system substrate-binding protein
LRLSPTISVGVWQRGEEGLDAVTARGGGRCAPGTKSGTSSKEKVVKKTGALLLIALVVVVAGCGSSGGEDSGAAGSDKKYVIGYINSVGEEGYPACAIEGMKAAAKAGGHELKVVTAVYDAEKEVSNTQALANQGVDAAINWPVAPATGKRVAQILGDANVPYFPFFAKNDAPEDQRMGSLIWDSYDFGLALGKWIKENRPNAVVLELDGSNADSGSNATKQGIADGIKGSSVKIKRFAETNWSPDEAGKLALELLPANPDVNLVITQNDLMALAVLRSIKQLGLTEKVDSVTDTTFTKQGLKAFQNGDMPYSAFDSAYKNGEDAFNQVVAILNGDDGGAANRMMTSKDVSEDDIGALPPLC